MGLRFEDACASAAGRRCGAATSIRERGQHAAHVAARRASAENNVASAAQTGGTRAIGVGFTGDRAPNASGDIARQVPNSHHDPPPITSGRSPDGLIFALANSWRLANPGVRDFPSKSWRLAFASGKHLSQLDRIFFFVRVQLCVLVMCPSLAGWRSSRRIQVLVSKFSYPGLRVQTSRRSLRFKRMLAVTQTNERRSHPPMSLPRNFGSGGAR
jgi:hypothetical protein